jgi:multidrug efflux pump subunit AcrA (membrane-fusion protein)
MGGGTGLRASAETGAKWKSMAIPSRRYRTRRATACGLAAVLTLSACGEKNTFVPPPPPKIEVALPLKKNVTRYLEATGNTAAVNTTTLVARVQGFIQAIKYKDGDAVKAGDVLFVIEQKPYQLTLEQAEAGQSSAAADTKKAEADYKRQVDLAAKNIASQSTLDQSTAAKDAAVATQKQS